MHLRTLATLGCSLCVAACSFGADEEANLTLIGAAGERIELHVELADEPAERQRGLMYRESLADGTGMLFVFEQEQPLAFWMKNTLIPLDILYFDAERQLVSVQTMVPCEKDPCTTYSSDAPAQYALEVNAGFVERYGIGEGWRFTVH